MRRTTAQISVACAHIKLVESTLSRKGSLYERILAELARRALEELHYVTRHLQTSKDTAEPPRGRISPLWMTVTKWIHYSVSGQLMPADDPNADVDLKMLAVLTRPGPERFNEIIEHEDPLMEELEKAAKFIVEMIDDGDEMELRMAWSMLTEHPELITVAFYETLEVVQTIMGWAIPPTIKKPAS